MDKYDSCIIQKILFIKAPIIIFYCGVFIEFIMLHQRCLKYLTQPLLIPVMMKMRRTIRVKAMAVKLVGSSLVKQQIV